MAMAAPAVDADSNEQQAGDNVLTQSNMTMKDGGAPSTPKRGPKRPKHCSTADADTWHHRLAHAHFDAVAKAAKVSVGMIMLGKAADGHRCSSCSMGKSKSSPYYRRPKTIRQPGELIHSDVAGPLPPSRLRKHRVAILYLDDATNYISLFCVKHKSDQLQCFKLFQTKGGIHTGCHEF